MKELQRFKSITSGVFLLLGSLWAMPLFSTHIVGGEMTYTYLGSNRYKIRLDVYIDCINGQAGAISSDAKAWIGVWDGNTRRILVVIPLKSTAAVRKGFKKQITIVFR